MFGATFATPFIFLFFFTASGLLVSVDAEDIETVLEDIYLLKGQKPSADLMNRVFRALDTKNKGYLEKEDMKSYVRDKFIPFLAKKIRQSRRLTDEQKDAWKVVLEKMTADTEDDQKLGAVFLLMDPNHDGKLDRNEFVERFTVTIQLGERAK